VDIDESVLDFIADSRVDVLDRLARGAMTAGTSLGVLAVGGLAVAVYVGIGRRWRLAAALGGAFVGATILTGVLKAVIDRPRPPFHQALVEVAGPAMPSTHAARLAAVAVALVVAFDWPSVEARRIGGVCLAAVVAGVSACLVYLGVHWMTDVIAGWALGCLVGFVAASVAQRVFLGPAATRAR
jgi:undecaprenyl-diphosphatase